MYLSTHVCGLVTQVLKRFKILFKQNSILSREFERNLKDGPKIYSHVWCGDAGLNLCWF